MVSHKETIALFSTITAGIGTIGVFVNGFLLFIYFRCPLKNVRQYRYFFLLTAIQDFIQAFITQFLTPITLTTPRSLIVIATGILRRPPIGMLENLLNISIHLLPMY
ncbi:hypothetical protein DICVIV_07488 [Dictyocaulus viviparus]|uniref:Uncharacterized protein n=1 Tax=Dictyocaulus viviparus TaxID=29172 RepID=A0A0D8XP90_DICVI|nr:hypothetical protein DICVIV_07488 [Dictyocaulus viviparus]